VSQSLLFLCALCGEILTAEHAEIAEMIDLLPTPFGGTVLTTLNPLRALRSLW
jgi:hypothetical protein